MSPTYHPAGEDGPNAMVARAQSERRLERRGRPSRRWTDPVRPGWPGPMKEWTAGMTRTFDRAYLSRLERNWPEGKAWAHAYGAVVKMPEGRS